MKKKIIHSMIFAIILVLAFASTTVNVAAATVSTAKYNSRPAAGYVISYGQFTCRDGNTYDHLVTIKTKKSKNKKIKLIETKGGRIGCYSWDSTTDKPYLMHYRDNKKSHYSGEIKYWLYEGYSAKGKVIASGTSKLDHSEYIKLPKANKTYTIKLQFFIEKGTHTLDYIGAATRYVGGKYPKWYINYDTKYFYKPSIKSVINNLYE